MKIKEGFQLREICGEYIDDFECDAQIGTDDFLSDFNAWLNEEITALF